MFRPIKPMLLSSLLLFILICTASTASQAAGSWVNYSQAQFETDSMRAKGYDIASIQCKHNPKAKLRTSGKLSNFGLLLKLSYKKAQGKPSTSLEAGLLNGSKDLSRFKQVYRSAQKYKHKRYRTYPAHYSVVRENNAKNGRPIVLCVVEKYQPR